MSGVSGRRAPDVGVPVSTAWSPTVRAASSGTRVLTASTWASRQANDGNCPANAPSSKANQGEGAGPQLTFDRESATSSHTVAAGYGQLTASQEGSSRRRLGVMPDRPTPPRSPLGMPTLLPEIHVIDSASFRDSVRPAKSGGPTTTISSPTSGSASISGAATKPPTTPSSARCERSDSTALADVASSMLSGTAGWRR